MDLPPPWFTGWSELWRTPTRMRARAIHGFGGFSLARRPWRASPPGPLLMGGFKRPGGESGKAATPRVRASMPYRARVVVRVFQGSFLVSLFEISARQSKARKPMRGRGGGEGLARVQEAGGRDQPSERATTTPPAAAGAARAATFCSGARMGKMWPLRGINTVMRR